MQWDPEKAWSAPVGTQVNAEGASRASAWGYDPFAG